MPAPISRRSDSTAPAASIEPAPRHARWRTIAPMPTTAPSSITQPSSIAAWPTMTSSPTTVGRSFAQWMTALSCTEAPAPIVMLELSPRSTAPNQMLARSPTRTSPTRTAVGAIQTASPIVGRMPPSSTITAIACRRRCLTACAQHYTVSPVSQVSYVRRRPDDDGTDRGARASHRGRGARASRRRQARRGAPAHVARVPEGHPAHPHRLGRHGAGERTCLPARRAARARAQQLRLGRLDLPGRARPRPHRLPPAGRPRRGHERAHLRARAEGVQVPLRVRRAARLLARARDGQHALRPGGLRAALRRPPVEHLRPVEARARQGRQGGDLPPAPRPHLGQEAVRRPRREAARAGGGRLDVHPHARVVRAARRAQEARHPARVRLQGPEQRRTAAGVDGRRRAVHGGGRHRRARPLGRGASALEHRLPLPGALRCRAQAVEARGRRDLLGRGDGALEGTRADERGVRRATATRLPAATGGRRMTAPPDVEARLWLALREVEAPEIPISVVGMGLIVSLAYRAPERAVDLELTFTAMGCPAMDFIQDDIRERLLAEPDVDEVRIEVVWDPLWTRSRIRDDARATMRALGIVA